MKIQLSNLILGTALMAASSSATKNSHLRSKNHRRLSLSEIAGYEPFTIVTDLNAIDLDVQKFTSLLDDGDEGDVGTATAIYTRGAFVRPVADVTVGNGGLVSDLATNVAIVGLDTRGQQVRVRSLGRYPQGSNQIQVRYEISESQTNYADCLVGALSASEQVTNRCLRAQGSLQTQENGAITIPYSYNVMQNNINNITLQSLSTNADLTHRSDCTVSPCQFNPTFRKYLEYFGHSDYADRFVRAALQRGSTQGGEIGVARRHDVNFGDANLQSIDVRRTAAYHGVVLLNIYMEVIGQMEQSVRQCRMGRVEARAHWDAAAAYYTGSLEGPNGNPNGGNLLHNLGDSLCPHFVTCGHNATLNSTKSFVNREVLRHFRFARRFLSNSPPFSDCNGIQISRTAIEQTMLITLIQGTLFFTHQRTISNLPVTRATAGTFAAALMPYIYSCAGGASTTSTDIRTLFDATSPNNAEVPDYGTVKNIIEKHYKCMNVTCANIGGIWDSSIDEYFDGTEPCLDAPTMAPTPAPTPMAVPQTTQQVPTVGPGGANPGSVAISGTFRVSTGGNNNNKRTAIIAGSISGAVVAGLLAICLLMYCTRRNKSLPPKMEPATSSFTAGATNGNGETTPTQNVDVVDKTKEIS